MLTTMVCSPEPTNRRWWPFVLLALVLCRYTIAVTHEFVLLKKHDSDDTGRMPSSAASQQTAVIATAAFISTLTEHDEKGEREDPETEDNELRLIMRLHHGGPPPQRDWQPADSDSIRIGQVFQAVV